MAQSTWYRRRRVCFHPDRSSAGAACVGQSRKIRRSRGGAEKEGSIYAWAQAFDWHRTQKDATQTAIWLLKLKLEFTKPTQNNQKLLIKK